jgi:two-component system sensor histidine kinase UhpB
MGSLHLGIEGVTDRIASRLRSVPLLYKVLGANVAIVLLGAIAGTYVTAKTYGGGEVPSRTELMMLFVTIGVILSVGANLLVLRAAFQPLESLERLAESVRDGDLSARAHPGPYSDPQISRLVDTFNSTLDELEMDQSRLRDLATQVVEAQEGERKRIARELHDDTAQVLFAQLLRLTALKTSPHQEIRDLAGNLESMTVEAIEGVRRLALELRPPALDDLGLREALAGLAQRFTENDHVDVRLQITGPRDRLAPEVELVLYRVAQEALTNVVKHARAGHATMSLRRDGQSVELTVADDGVGYAPEPDRERDEGGLGLGVFGMVERTMLVGGQLAIRRLVPHGTQVMASIPIDANGSPAERATHQEARKPVDS